MFFFMIMFLFMISYEQATRTVGGTMVYKSFRRSRQNRMRSRDETANIPGFLVFFGWVQRFLWVVT